MGPVLPRGPTPRPGRARVEPSDAQPVDRLPPVHPSPADVHRAVGVTVPARRNGTAATAIASAPLSATAKSNLVASGARSPPAARACKFPAARILIRSIDESGRNPDHQAQVALVMEQPDDPSSAPSNGAGRTCWRYVAGLGTAGTCTRGTAPGSGSPEPSHGRCCIRPVPRPGWHVASRAVVGPTQAVAGPIVSRTPDLGPCAASMAADRAAGPTVPCLQEVG